MNPAITKVRKAVVAVVRKRLAPILPALVVAAVVAILALAVAEAFDLYDRLADPVATVLWWDVSPQTAVFLAGLAVGLLVGAVGLYYWNNRTQIHATWRRYPTWSRALAVGGVSAVVVLGALGGLALTRGVTTYAVATGTFLTWPVVSGAYLLQKRRIPNAGVSRRASIRTGYVHARGLETRTLSVIVGAITAVATLIAVRMVVAWYAGRLDLWLTLTVVALVWAAVTLVLYNRVESSTAERSDLTIVAISDPDADDARELTVRNESNESIDLAESWLRDTEFDLFVPDVDVVLKPGEACTFELPESFSVEEPIEGTSNDLPLNYSRETGSETPTLFSKRGEVFSLGNHASEDAATDRPPATDVETDAPPAGAGTEPTPQD